MTEKRDSARHRVLKTGTIDLGGGAIDCMVRNLSQTGAALEVVSQVGVPEQFTLIVDGGGPRSCRVAWRRGRRIGVAFERE